jgi:hypothetical protein
MHNDSRAAMQRIAFSAMLLSISRRPSEMNLDSASRRLIA